MALNATRLGTALANAAGCPSTDTVGQATWQAIASVIVAEFTVNAVVTPAGSPAMNVVVGAPGATPVAGNGRVT